MSRRHIFYVIDLEEARTGSPNASAPFFYSLCALAYCWGLQVR